MKKTFVFLFLVASLFIAESCKKEKSIEPEPAPVPDPYTYSDNTQTSKDISSATYAILDIDMMAGFIGERILFSHFYSAKPSSAPMNTVVCIVDTFSKQMAMSFNNTNCVDGKNRDGTIFLEYAYDFNTNRDAKDNAKYYRDYGFSASLNLMNYKVGDWLIELFDPAKPANIINRVSAASYDPKTTNLTWEITGKFKISNLHATGRDIVWEGKIIKTLINTNDPAIFNPNKFNPIKWNLAKVNYSGEVKGTIDNVSYTYSIDKTDKLLRNFNCNVVPSGGTEVTQFHPFILGKAVFAWGNFHPRTINYGPIEVCDHSGTISFKDESKTVDFD